MSDLLEFFKGIAVYILVLHILGVAVAGILFFEVYWIFDYISILPKITLLESFFLIILVQFLAGLFPLTAIVFNIDPQKRFKLY